MLRWHQQRRQTAFCPFLVHTLSKRLLLGAALGGTVNLPLLPLLSDTAFFEAARTKQSISACRDLDDFKTALKPPAESDQALRQGDRNNLAFTEQHFVGESHLHMRAKCVDLRPLISGVEEQTLLRTNVFILNRALDASLKVAGATYAVDE